MKLSEEHHKILMLSLHQKIEEYAVNTANKLHSGDTENLLTYPPNHGFTRGELQALEKLSGDSPLQSALRKVLANNSAGVVFELMNLLDGTTDPDEELGDWTGIALVDSDEVIEENEEMLHDSFYASYWDWRERRPDTAWQLDTFEG